MGGHNRVDFPAACPNQRKTYWPPHVSVYSDGRGGARGSRGVLATRRADLPSPLEDAGRVRVAREGRPGRCRRPPLTPSPQHCPSQTVPPSARAQPVVVWHEPHPRSGGARERVAGGRYLSASPPRRHRTTAYTPAKAAFSGNSAGRGHRHRPSAGRHLHRPHPSTTDVRLPTPVWRERGV